MYDSYTFSAPTIIHALRLVRVKLVLRTVPYSIMEDGFRQIAPKFAVSDTASVLVHHCTLSLVLSLSEICFLGIGLGDYMLCV